MYSFLNRITMYRLMLYFLLVLWTQAIVLSAIGVLSYNPIDIALTGIALLVMCTVANQIFAKLFHAKTNLESQLITALIITLIVGPVTFFSQWMLLIALGTLAMASKYLLAIKKRHVFNPTAFAVFLTGMVWGTGASWWIGDPVFFPTLLIGGIGVLLKTKRVTMVVTFLSISLSLSLLTGTALDVNLLYSPFWFFAFVMLIEPLTSPATRRPQVMFSAFIALSFFALQKLFPFFPYGLEASLLLGNIFSFILFPKATILLTFNRKEEIAARTWSLFFIPSKTVVFKAGQFLEWTCPHKNPDARGVRRYFTIASAPYEKEISITLRMFEDSSSFKKKLLSLTKGEELVAIGPQGNFTLLQETTQPLCFIAGGIGVTPFRSMIADLLKKQEKRDIVLFYANSTPEEIAFKELFEKAKPLGIKTFFVVTQRDGHIDAKMLQEKMPDYKKRFFYLSGPQPMVDSFKKLLANMQISRVKTDFFPGYEETYQK